MSWIPLDYSRFSICGALGLPSLWPSVTPTTMPVAPQEPSFAERESCPPSNQRNQDDVDITSCPTHSLNPTPQHQHFIPPQHSFSNSNTSQGYGLPRSDSASSPRGYQKQYFLPSGARFAIHQPQQPDRNLPSAEMVLVPEEWPARQDQLIEAANSITYPLSPLYTQSVLYSRPTSADHAAPVSSSIESTPVYNSSVEQGSSQAHGRGSQHVNVTDASSARLSHDVRTSTQLPSLPSLADPQRMSCPGKRSRRTSSGDDVAGPDTTTKNGCPASNFPINCAVPAPHASRSSAHPRTQHNNAVAPRMGMPHTAPRKVECGGRVVDECAVHNAVERGQPLLHVYECKWNKAHAPCRMYIEGDQSSVTDHLLRFHNFTGGEENTACLWEGCRSKRRSAMKGTSIARHIVTHIGHKVQCTACSTEFAREDACKRSHINARSRCRTMQMDIVHGAGVITLEVQKRKPVAKKRRLVTS